MKKINTSLIQASLESYFGKSCYVHFEMTNGAYASYRHGQAASGYVRNVNAHIIEGKIVGDGPYRVGLKTEDGWIYADGLTTVDDSFADALLLYGFDADGKMQIALQISETPFK